MAVETKLYLTVDAGILDDADQDIRDAHAAGDSAEVTRLLRQRLDPGLMPEKAGSLSVHALPRIGPVDRTAVDRTAAVVIGLHPQPPGHAAAVRSLFSDTALTRRSPRRPIHG